MKQRKIPLRKSVVSGEMKPKKEMVRITRSKEGEVSIDPTGKCLDEERMSHLSRKKYNKLGIKILDRVLETTLTDEFYQELLDYVTHQKHVKSYLENEYS